MLHACVQRFDVTENLKNLAEFSGTKLDLSELSWHWIDRNTSCHCTHFHMTCLLQFLLLMLVGIKQLFVFLVCMQNRTHVAVEELHLHHIGHPLDSAGLLPWQGVVTITDSCCYYGKQLLTLTLKHILILFCCEMELGGGVGSFSVSTCLNAQLFVCPEQKNQDLGIG